MEVIADLLAEGHEPDEITTLQVLHRELVSLINFCVDFELVANNIDRPGPDGKYDPRWYTAQGVQTGFHEALYGVLSDLLRCEVLSSNGDRCYVSEGHGGLHADGNGVSWLDDGQIV